MATKCAMDKVVDLGGLLFGFLAPLAAPPPFFVFSPIVKYDGSVTYYYTPAAQHQGGVTPQAR
jgi:hypothetical protein